MKPSHGRAGAGQFAPLAEDDEGVTAVELQGGLRLSIRPMHADDEQRLVDFHAGLSADTIYRRFFSAHPRLAASEVHRFTHLDYEDRFALVAVDSDGRMVGVGRYDRPPGSDHAEVAFVVADALQGRGLGSALLARLARIARRHDIRRFDAQTFVDNQKMLGVFRHAGFRETTRYSDGIVVVTLELDEPCP